MQRKAGLAGLHLKFLVTPLRIANAYRFKQKGKKRMKKYVCTICGFIHEGEALPSECLQCKATADKFDPKDEGGLVRADEHKIEVAQGIDQEIIEGLKKNFQGECTEIGIYLAMSRQAAREGHPVVAEAYHRIAMEEADHAATFAELLGDVVKPDTRDNLVMRIEAEKKACDLKKELAAKAKELNYDAIHDTVQVMCKDETRHRNVFAWLLKRYF